MLIRRFKPSVLKDMGNLKLKVIDIKTTDTDDGSSVLVKCQHVDSGRYMHLRVNNPTASNAEFDYTNSFVVDAAVSNSRRVYSTYEFVCRSVEVASASGDKVKIERGA